MSSTYPFIPKSNSKLKAGQFWPIKLSNGHYACGMVLSVTPKEDLGTKMFFAGLLDWTGVTKPTKKELESAHLKVIAQGKAHIKTITANGDAIEGEIDLENSGVLIPLQSQSTWGYNVIYKKAESQLVQ